MMDELKPAQPQSLGERLLGLMYGGTDAESEYYKRQAREAELRRMEQKAFEDQGGGLEAQIPGGNPEVPTPLDALVGALMSMGGVPPSVARSGTAPTVPAPRPAQKNSLIASEPEWMSSAPGGRVRIGPPIQEMNRTIRDQERDARPAGMPIGPKLIGPTIQERNKILESSPPSENMAPYNSPEDLATGASQRIISAIMEKQNRANASPPPKPPDHPFRGGQWTEAAGKLGDEAAKYMKLGEEAAKHGIEGPRGFSRIIAPEMAYERAREAARKAHEAIKRGETSPPPEPTSQPEPAAPGGRTRQTRIETPDGFVIEPPDKIEGIPIYRVGKKTSSGIEWFEGANSLREAKSRLKQAQSQPSPPPEPAVGPRRGLGFPSKEGQQAKGFAESKYKFELPVRVTFPDGSTHTDIIKGLNKSHALERAKYNWEGATIEPISRAEVEGID